MDKSVVRDISYASSVRSRPGRMVIRAVENAIGRPIPPEALARHGGDATAMMDFLRRTTYDLSPDVAGGAAYGYEFEAKYRA